MIVTNDIRKVARWQNHFQSITSKPSQDEEPDTTEVEIGSEVDPPTEDD